MTRPGQARATTRCRPLRRWSPLTTRPELTEGTAPCPYCGEAAEPEQDGGSVYFACPGCGGEFGYRKAGQGESCAAGLSLAAPGPDGPVLIATTITRRPE